MFLTYLDYFIKYGLPIIAIGISIWTFIDNRQNKKNDKHLSVYQETKNIMDNFCGVYNRWFKDTVTFDDLRNKRLKNNEDIISLLARSSFLVSIKSIFDKYDQTLRRLPDILKETKQLLKKIEELENYQKYYKPTKKTSPGIGFSERPDPEEWATTDKAKEYTEDIFRSLYKINKMFNKIVDKVKITI